MKTDLTIYKMLTKELATLENARNAIANLFDMGYSYEESIDIIAGIDKDIADLKEQLTHY
jgi:hypothetical protein